MHWIGIIAVILGVIIGLVGDWMILIRAYRRSRLLFFECLAIPLAAYMFAILDMERPLIPLALSFGGIALVLVGFIGFGADFWSIWIQLNTITFDA